MKRDLKFYQEWYNKWIKLFRYLCDKTSRSHKVDYLIQEIKKHLNLIEWRLQCYKWLGEEAEKNKLFPKRLK